MPIDPGLLSGIAGLVERDPTNLALRLHLAKLLLDDEQAAEALVHVSHALAACPDDVKALALGATAAEIAGDSARAESYRRMAAALGPAPSTAAAVGPPDLPAVDDSGKSRLGLRLIEGNRVDDTELDVEVQKPAITLAALGHHQQRCVAESGDGRWVSPHPDRRR